ncbi:MAG: hypothetical protein F6K11_33065 [Leptolyngbya sp. SIO3F4]|nr:hypothetical protein [Leptolyngbya sp. SIO3F4]
MDKKSNRGVMLFISVLLHGLLALLPWQEKSRPLAVSSTSTGPIRIVDASQLPTLSASESQPASPSQPRPLEPAVPPTPTVAIPVDPPAADWTADAPISETSDSPESAPEAATDTDWTGESSIPETSDSPVDGTAPDASPGSDPTSVTTADDGAKIAADLDYLVGYLKDQDKGFGFTLFEIFDLFGESEEQVNQFFDENKQPKLDVSSFSHFPEQTPEQVWQTVVMPELTSNTDFDPQPQENVSAGLVYQLLQGEMLRYLIIVRLNEESGSVLMLSDSLAGLEP